MLPDAPSHRPQTAAFEPAVALRATRAPGTTVMPGWGWSPGGVREELLPDVMVHRTTEENLRLTSEPPLLVVEVLSGNRRTDLVDKMFRYARWDAVTYWVADLRDRELAVHTLAEGMSTVAAVHTGGEVMLRYGEVEVAVDLDALWA